MNDSFSYDVIIIGGGASGTALLYTLAQDSAFGRVALVEKHDQLGMVNSNGRNNSQSLHVGDIEMHYSREKAAAVKPGALMIPEYLETLGAEKSAGIMRTVQKMALAVGAQEVAEMRERYHEFEGLFPTQRMLGRDEIAEVEPKIVEGRNPSEPILALYDPNGHAVDYQKLAESFVAEALETRPETIDVLLGSEVTKIEKLGTGYRVSMKKDGAETLSITTRTVVVNTDSYSLLFAKSLGYGREYSLVPVGASFYYSPEILRGKVYPMQDRKLPFAGVHGDPDLHMPNATRWGPTAKFYPVLESDQWKTTRDYFRSAGLGRWKALKSFLKVLFDPVRFWYFAKSMTYDLPLIGKYLFIKNVKKIVPTVRAKDLRLAKGVGGMRLQRININTGEMEMGEGKIIGDNIIFNMTPSPGASVCLFNAKRDAEVVRGFLEGQEGK